MLFTDRKDERNKHWYLYVIYVKYTLEKFYILLVFEQENYETFGRSNFWKTKMMMSL